MYRASKKKLKVGNTMDRFTGPWQPAIYGQTRSCVYSSPFFQFSQPSRLTARVKDYEGKPYLHLCRNKNFCALEQKEFNDLVGFQAQLTKYFEEARREIIKAYGQVTEDEELIEIPRSQLVAQKPKKRKLQRLPSDSDSSGSVSSGEGAGDFAAEEKAVGSGSPPAKKPHV